MSDVEVSPTKKAKRAMFLTPEERARRAETMGARARAMWAKRREAANTVAQ
jgi:hypothetical protein